MILIWRFGDRVNIAKLTYTIIDPSILQAWVFLHAVLKTANLKSRQQHFMSKLPNIMFANNSAYTAAENTGGNYIWQSELLVVLLNIG